MKLHKIMAALIVLSLTLSLFPGVEILSKANAEEDSYTYIEEGQTPIASVERTGNVDYTRINDGVLNNVTNTWAFGKTEGAMDYYGYTFDHSYTIKQVIFYSGAKYSDGGWFAEAPVIRVLQDGSWTEVSATVSPAYDAQEYTAYTFDFDAVSCDGVMVYGKAGGTAYFISCAELKVLGRSDAAETSTTTRYEFERYVSQVSGDGKISAQWMGDYENSTGYSWSRHYQMLWLRSADEDTLTFSFDVAADAPYQISLGLVQAADFGSFAFYIDDTQFAQADEHGDSLMTDRAENLATLDLTAGTHTFQIVALDDEDGHLNGGFDYFELERMDWIESESKPIASVVRTGNYAPAHINDGDLSTNCNLFEFNKTEESIDYIGYEFSETRTVSELDYYEGSHFVDGGWFREAPVIKVLRDGVWSQIEATVTPAYDAQENGKYIYTFDPVDCDGIMVYGKPGGSVYFISCAEIKVLAEPKAETIRPDPEVTYSYADIASRLYDMEELARVPDGETSSEFTSGDTSSTYNSVSGDYENWNANGDWTGYLYRQDDGGYVIAEMDGPGYINRIWMAYEWSGKIAVYVDGSDTPVIQDTCSKLFDETLFPYDQLSYESVDAGGVMGGFDCYVPITYNESCKVVLYNSSSNSFGNFSYYQVGYTTLPDTAAVESFAYPLSDADSAALNTANEILAGRSDAPISGTTTEKTFEIPSGGVQTVFQADGEGAVSFLEINTGISADQFAAAQDLTGLYMSVYYDGNENPSVYTTLGDLFGTPYGITPYDSYIMGVREDGTLYMRWYMPYADGIQIVISNQNSAAETLTVSVTTDTLSAPAEEYCRFNAEWNLLSERDSSDSRYPDSGFLSTEGTGRFVGVSMHIYQLADSLWWGEGDEKFFVDGEKYPSWYGTGSEDYFGYAWCQGTVFNEAYHGQSLCEGNLGVGKQTQDHGNKVNYRFHISDSVSFYSSFDANMEKYFDDRYVKMAATSFYYLTAEDTAQNIVNQFTAEERDFNEAEGREPALYYEGEEMTRYFTEITNGTVSIQNMEYAMTDTLKWSGNSQLWWRNTAAGSTAAFTVDLPEQMNYDIAVSLTTASDYGTVSVYVDDQAVGDAIDCYSSALGVQTVSLGQLKLSAGEHTIKLAVTGKNAASGGYFIGLDALDFSPQILLGDLDQDGRVTVSDVVELRGRIMAAQEPSALTLQYADIDGNSEITVSDVVELRDLIIKGTDVGGA